MRGCLSMAKENTVFYHINNDRDVISDYSSQLDKCYKIVCWKSPLSIATPPLPPFMDNVFSQGTDHGPF